MARKTWITGRAAEPSALPAALMSASLARARAATRTERISSDTIFTESTSPGEAIGKPASMMSTPSFSSWRARRIFSAAFIEHPGDCSPSRRVVSKMVMRPLI